MYGNIGQVSCRMSTLMGGVSGSAVADASMECRILGPEMTRLGYDRGWSAAINGLSGLIVATIPPSMGLIIYGTVGEVSIGRLFMAGWVPGILMCVLLMLAVTWSARRFGYKPEHDHPAPLSEILKALLDSIWAILFPVLLIVLIRFGIMSPTESGSFACAYALLVGTVFYHELTWESLLQTLRDSVKDITVITIILAFSGVFGYGMIVNALLTAFSNFIIAVAGDSDGMMSIKFWTMGSLTRAGWKNIGPITLIVLAAAVFFRTQAQTLDGLMLGEEAASTIGINTFRCRLVYLLVLSVLTGALVSVCGTIGFVGLIIPHVSRAIAGTAHRKLLPIAAFSGGLFMLWVDAIARSLIPNTELPVGIFTALVGAPFFVYVMVRKKYGFGGN